MTIIFLVIACIGVMLVLYGLLALTAQRQAASGTEVHASEPRQIDPRETGMTIYDAQGMPVVRDGATTWSDTDAGFNFYSRLPTDNLLIGWPDDRREFYNQNVAGREVTDQETAHILALWAGEE